MRRYTHPIPKSRALTERKLAEQSKAVNDARIKAQAVSSLMASRGMTLEQAEAEYLRIGGRK